MTAAKIHSIETSGFFDGPGIRTVIFFQGCPLRCIYCHNPDTWNCDEGDIFTVSELLEKVKRYKNYYRTSGGGVTLSGGEPLLQTDFVLEFIRACKKEGIHVTLDLSGYLPEGNKYHQAELILQEADLILLDIKGTSAQTYLKMTASKKYHLPQMTDLLNTFEKKVWARYVVIPGMNDSESELEQVRQILKSIDGLQKIDVLPFHQLGKYKYESLGISYKLKNHPEMSAEDAKIIEKKLLLE